MIVEKSAHLLEDFVFCFFLLPIEYLAKDQITENTVFSFGDIIFKEYILNELLNDGSDITMIVDADWTSEGKNIDYVQTDIPYSKKVFSMPVAFVKMSNILKEKDIVFLKSYTNYIFHHHIYHKYQAYKILSQLFLKLYKNQYS